MIGLRDLLVIFALSPIVGVAQWWDRRKQEIALNRWACVAVYWLAYGTTLAAAVRYTA